MKKVFSIILVFALLTNSFYFFMIDINANSNIGSSTETEILRKEDGLEVVRYRYNVGENNEYEIINVNNQGLKTVFDSRTMEVSLEDGTVISTIKTIDSLLAPRAYYNGDFVAGYWTLMNSKWTTMQIYINNSNTTISILVSACSFAFGWAPGVSLAASIATALITHASSSGNTTGNLKQMTFGNTRVISDIGYLYQAFNAGEYVKTMRYDSKLKY